VHRPPILVFLRSDHLGSLLHLLPPTIPSPSLSPTSFFLCRSPRFLAELYISSSGSLFFFFSRGIPAMIVRVTVSSPSQEGSHLYPQTGSTTCESRWRSCPQNCGFLVFWFLLCSILRAVVSLPFGSGFLKIPRVTPLSPFEFGEFSRSGFLQPRHYFVPAAGGLDNLRPLFRSRVWSGRFFLFRLL